METHTAIGAATEPDERIRLEWAQALSEQMELKNVSVRDLIRELTEQFDITISRQAVESWLAGKTAPRPVTQAAIGTILGVPASRLFKIDNLPRKASA